MKEGRFPTLVPQPHAPQEPAGRAAMKEGRFPTLVSKSEGVPYLRLVRRNEGGSVSDPRYARRRLGTR